MDKNKTNNIELDSIDDYEIAKSFLMEFDLRASIFPLIVIGVLIDENGNKTVCQTISNTQRKLWFCL